MKDRILNMTVYSRVVTIFRKEVASFFNSPEAYIVLTAFLVGVGLFFWVFGETPLNTMEASMENLFFFAPWFFLFLIPAITMRSFAEEFKQGTIELLSAKPISDWQIILGKWLAANFLMIFALLPTLVYYFSLQAKGAPPNNLDTGPIWGAYLGMIALGCIFTSIGMLSSAISNSQVVAFVIGSFLCFFFFYGFDFLAEVEAFQKINLTIQKIGINHHYMSIKQGVIDTRDIVYFVSS